MRLDGGRASLRTIMAAADLHDLMRRLPRRQAAGAPMGAVLTAPVVRAAAGASPGIGATAPEEGTADFWMDRGGLLSAYGNYQGAVRCFQKALTLEPRLAEAAFQLGVAYGELGLFERAVEALSRAIAQEPARGHYYYGRGRVYLLAGEEDLAMQDFMEAAFLGDVDARTYLRETSGVSWQ
jgi:tetratricopeptide (TPR) repeat protein